MRILLLIPGVSLLMLGVILLCVHFYLAQYRPIQPSPELTSIEVVEAQLLALQRNHASRNHSGIHTAFSFASPANRVITGPVERFVDILHMPRYRPLLNHRSHRVVASQSVDDLSEHLVEITDSDNQSHRFIFRLTRQSEGIFKGCWMTDGVIVIDPLNIPITPSAPQLTA